MRHMTVPSNGTIHQRNGTRKLEREFTVRKRHYIWSESAGTDFIIARDGRIAALYLFFDKLP